MTSAVVAAGLVAATAWMVLAVGPAWRSGPAWARVAGLVSPPPSRPEANPRFRWLAARLTDAAVAGRASRWVALWSVGTAAMVAAAVLAGGMVLGLVGLGASVGGSWLALATRRGRGDSALEAALPPLLEATARGMRAGASLPTALATAAGTGSPLVVRDIAGVMAESSEVGLVVALERWAVARPLPAVRLAAAALALAIEVGGGGARALDGVALTLRQRQAAGGEVRALATQARLSAVVLTLAPLAFAALASVGDPRTAAILLRSPVGQGCLAFGLALDAVGAAWMARVTRAGAA